MASKLFHLILLVTLAIQCLGLESKLGHEEEMLSFDDDNLTVPKLFIPPGARKVCSAPGPMCKDCKTRVNCVQISENEWEEVGQHTCAQDETCHRTQCTVEPNPPCGEAAKQKFKCQSIGMFPDQFDCQRYHMCVAVGYRNFDEFTYQCGNKWMYNALSTYCDIPFPADGYCYAAEADPQWPVPACLEDRQHNAIQRNPSIYYTCEKYDNTENLYPMLRLCPNGGIYNIATRLCEAKETLIDV